MLQLDKIPIQDEHTNRLQSNIADAFNRGNTAISKQFNKTQSNIDTASADIASNLALIQALQAGSFSGGVILSGTANPGNGVLVLTHGLGSTPSGWVVLDNDTACWVNRTAWSSTTITLHASTNAGGAGATLTVWVK